jgi:hypothetical protein
MCYVACVWRVSYAEPVPGRRDPGLLPVGVQLALPPRVSLAPIRRWTMTKALLFVVVLAPKLHSGAVGWSRITKYN